LIEGETGLLDPCPGYALAKDLKKRSLTEKIRLVMPICPVMPELCPKPKKPWLLRAF